MEGLRLRVTLASSNNWEQWISSVKIIARVLGIWKYIDPDQPNTSRPEKPVVPSLKEIDQSDKELLHSRFQAELMVYEAKLWDWDDYQESYQKL
ncbi:hypothetical protein PHISCL_05641 [Aspergillus sclerotialis]|uniref:Uncharacterized protein n=1 Tax=Aspergillus sclerotialis TaxID=2070753 RepID=A0A3A2ZG90_9EURO|nr:hypothetical protein PHISCL_05641 [Aspergillus sclerotialis]